MNTKTKKLLLSLGLPIITGAAALIISAFTEYPFEMLAPPFFKFPIKRFCALWIFDAFLSGIAFSRVITSVATYESHRDATALFAIRQFFVLVWPLLFFCLKEYTFSLLWLSLLWAVTYTARKYYGRIDNLSGFFLLPCLIIGLLMIYFSVGVWIIWNLG